MAYIKTNWVNDQAPAINANNLNKIEEGIYNNDTSIGTLSNLTTTEKTNLVGAINEVNNKRPIIAQNRVNSQVYNINSGDYLPFTKQDYNNSNGKIVFNSDGSTTINHTGYIRVSLLIWFAGNSSQRPWIKFRNLTQSNEFGHFINDIGPNGFTTYAIPNCIVPVNSGDRIGVSIHTSNNQPIGVNSSSGNYASFMNIEII